MMSDPVGVGIDKACIPLAALFGAALAGVSDAALSAIARECAVEGRADVQDGSYGAAGTSDGREGLLRSIDEVLIVAWTVERGGTMRLKKSRVQCHGVSHMAVGASKGPGLCRETSAEPQPHPHH